eukprot:7376196-Prymnesium_polylepis.1
MCVVHASSRACPATRPPCSIAAGVRCARRLASVFRCGMGMAVAPLGFGVVCCAPGRALCAWLAYVFPLWHGHGRCVFGFW